MSDTPEIPIGPRAGDLLPPLPPPPPPPGYYYAGPPPAPPRRRGPLLAILGVLVVGALAAAAFLVMQGDDPDPDKILEAAQETVGDAESFSFTMDIEAATALQDEDSETGTTTTSHATGDGAWSDGLWQIRQDFGFGVSDIVFDGTTLYERDADDADELEGEKWTSIEDAVGSREDLVESLDMGVVEEFEADGMEELFALMLASELYLGAEGDTLIMQGALDSGFASDPTGFLDGIQRMADPTFEGEADGVTTVAATLQAPADIVEAFGHPIPDGRVELDVGDGDLPVALRLSIGEGANKLDFAIEFTAWNEPVDIHIPSADEIDDSFDEDDEGIYVDEEGLRAAAARIALVWPTAGVEGWSLTTWSPEELDDDGPCAPVELDWDGDEDYLYLTLQTAACALEDDPTPFEPGGPGGLPSRDDADGYVEVQVGETVVTVDTSLEGADLDAVLASLAPVDVETLITAANASD